MKKIVLKSMVGLIIVVMSLLNFSFNKKGNDVDLKLLNLNKIALADCDVWGWVYPAEWIIIIYDPCNWECVHGGTNACPI